MHALALQRQRAHHAGRGRLPSLPAGADAQIRLAERPRPWSMYRSRKAGTTKFDVFYVFDLRVPQTIKNILKCIDDSLRYVEVHEEFMIRQNLSFLMVSVNFNQIDIRAFSLRHLTRNRFAPHTDLLHQGPHAGRYRLALRRPLVQVTESALAHSYYSVSRYRKQLDIGCSRCVW